MRCALLIASLAASLFFACRAPSAPGDLAATFAPYDFRGATPAKLTALLGPGAPLPARYAVAQVRLDWLLAAWINHDSALLGALGDHLQVQRCSQREEFDRCLEELPAKIRDQLGEVDSSVSEAAGLRSLLAALSTGPRSAVQAAALDAAVKRPGPAQLRAHIALLASARTRLAENPFTRERALAALLRGLPFACPERFLALSGTDPDAAAYGFAPFCSYACPAHQSADYGRAALLSHCPPAHFGLTDDQGHFLSPRNFLLHRALGPLLTALNAVESAPQGDPLFPLLSPGLAALTRDIGMLRLPAELPTVALPSAEAPLVAFQGGVYVYLASDGARIALWPTFGPSGAPGRRAASLREGGYLHPGLDLGADPAGALSAALGAASEADRALGPRLAAAPPPSSAPASAPDGEPVPSAFGPRAPLPADGLNPEGTRPRGDSLDLLSDPGVTLDRLYPVAIAGREAGFGRLRLVTTAATPATMRAFELLPTRGEELAFPAKTPRGFPGGALVLVLQRAGLRAVLPPGLEGSALPPLALSGVARGAGGFDSAALKDFWMTFLPQRVILAASPGTTAGELAEICGALVRRAPSVEIALVVAPEEGDPTWIAGLPRALYPSFLPLAPADHYDPDSVLDPF